MKIIKEMSVKFFFWWYSQPGSNTYEAYDKWWKEYGRKLYRKWVWKFSLIIMAVVFLIVGITVAITYAWITQMISIGS